MSWPALMAARFAKVDTTAHLLLIGIAFHADDAGRAWLTVSRLAKEIGCGPRTVERALRRLVDAKVIEISYRPGRASEFTIAGVRQFDGGGASNRRGPPSNRHPTLFKEDDLKDARASSVDPSRDPDAAKTPPAVPSISQRRMARAVVADAKRTMHKGGA